MKKWIYVASSCERAYYKGRTTLPRRRPKHTLNTNTLYSGKGKHDQTIFSTRCWTVVIVVFMDMVTFIKVFMVRFFVIANLATITRTFHIWCPNTRLQHKDEHKLRATCCCDKSTGEDNPNWRVYTETHSHAHLFSAAVVVVLRHTHLTHSAHFSSFTVQGGIEKSFHQVIRRWLALLEWDGYHLHNDELTPCICATTCAPCLAVWRYTKLTQF